VAAPAAPAPAPAAALHAPRTVTRGRLVVIAKSGADGPSYPFGDTLDVGRLEGQIVVGEDPYLSPRHVRIAWTGSKLVLRDLASTNGVYIRLVAARDASVQSAGKAGRGAPAAGAPVPGEVAVPLHDQDLILVGQQVLRFETFSLGAHGEPGAHGEVGFGPATEHGTLLFGSPAAPSYARLSQRTVEGVTRDVYYVRKVETVLGRESGDVVFTEDPFLSRRHAAIRVLGRDGVPLAAGSKGVSADAISFALVDLGSSNGSFLRIRNELELVPGDHFRVGQQLFRVDFHCPGSGGLNG
jgi:pSer/pThr/pTyr-binding forkhead associated (FHA) protein